MFSRVEWAHLMGVVGVGSVAASVVKWLPWALGITIAVLSIVVQVAAYRAHREKKLTSKAQRRAAEAQQIKEELEIEKLKEE